jgi:hypothetical protein
VALGAGHSRLQDVVVDVSGGFVTLGVAPFVPGEDVSAEIAGSRLAVVGGSGVGALAGSEFQELVIKDSTVAVSGGGTGVDGSVGAGGSYLLDGVTIAVTGGGVGVGIGGPGTQLVRNSLVTVSGGVEARGLSRNGADFDPLVEGTRVLASDASVLNAGISSNSGSPRVLASQIRATGAGATAVRLGSAPFPGDIDVSGSILAAATVLTSVGDNPSTRFRIGATQLDGATITTGTATYVCTDSYTSTFAPLGANCS